MRRLTAVVASGLLLGGVVLASPAAYADHSKGLDDFKLTGEFTDFDFDDTGKDGPSRGDTVTFAMDLFDDDGDEAGDGDGTCELTKVNREDHEFSADCESVFHLDDGDLEMEGEVTDEDFKNKEVTQDITGGTDDYDEASGTVTFTPADDHGDGGHRHAHGYSAQHAGHGDAGPDHGGHGHGGHGGGGHGDGKHGKGHGDHK
ncbi:MAG: allene oxide cyclase barrel-like domain-containing protein, partial [Acidimicrobiia bacterium]